MISIKEKRLELKHFKCYKQVLKLLKKSRKINKICLIMSIKPLIYPLLQLAEKKGKENK